MPSGGPISERVLILMPRGRDSQLASNLLGEAGRATFVCADVGQLHGELGKGAALAIVAEEAFATSKLEELAGWVRAQPPWSDFPLIVLTAHGDTPERNIAAGRWQTLLGNVSYLERPFHPTTLVSVVHSAMRSRRRQYQARELLERYELLARELQHRTKNLLSVILSIGASTLKGSQERDAFFSRLHALAKAQDLLMEGGGRGALLKNVIEQGLQSFGSRVKIFGPDIFLKPSAAQGFALILHELATNASKYGAFTADGGTVAVRWRLDGNSAEPTIIFEWQERGGPPATPPAQKGFGSVLLQHAVANPDNPPRFEYAPEGFTYELTVAHACTPLPHGG